MVLCIIQSAYNSILIMHINHIMLHRFNADFVLKSYHSWHSCSMHILCMYAYMQYSIIYAHNIAAILYLQHHRYQLKVALIIIIIQLQGLSNQFHIKSQNRHRTEINKHSQTVSINDNKKYSKCILSNIKLDFYNGLFFQQRVSLCHGTSTIMLCQYTLTTLAVKCFDTQRRRCLGRSSRIGKSIVLQFAVIHVIQSLAQPLSTTRKRTQKSFTSFTQETRLSSVVCSSSSRRRILPDVASL